MGNLIAVGELDDVARALTHVVTQISERQLDVTNVYTKLQRTEFANQLPKEIVVSRTVGPDGGIPLHTTTDQNGKREESTPPTRDRPRSHLIPDDCALNVTDARIHEIERELRVLSLSRNPNAVAVLFRVFIEMSVDSYISREGITIPDQAKLRARLNKTVEHLVQRQKLTNFHATPVILGARRVHNQHMSPIPNEDPKGLCDRRFILGAVDHTDAPLGAQSAYVSNSKRSEITLERPSTFPYRHLGTIKDYVTKPRGVPYTSPLSRWKATVVHRRSSVAQRKRTDRC